MSSTARSGPNVPEEKKRKGGLLSRMKTVLKRSDGSKRLSFSAKPTAAPTSSAAEPSTTKKAKPTVASKEEELIEESKLSPDEPQLKKMIRSEVHAERARVLGERFRVTIEPQQYTGGDKIVYRIEKPIRVRIHRQCHKCNTVFGGNKICSSCEHVRCKGCPRYPPLKTGKDKEKALPAALSPSYIEPDTYWNLKEEITLTKPNPKPGCQPLVRKKPMQRVRRNCCACSALFMPNSKICPRCEHGRCTDCPRDPEKKKKYPHGYPGDLPSSNPANPVRYACHHCTKAYPPVPHPDSVEEQPAQSCARCGHQRCGSCERAPPVRVDPTEPDPEVLKRVEAKLAMLSLSFEGRGEGLGN
ncbi:hypothetical protein HYFRA_00004739 [Hymenoscyphus fraxineus]|uniref:Uncharacterized protein n=1 Tax=Hymenoscyphus fraxineus TaxID=746836 RepID=A0A9N9KXW7_9HELO|nr:hypothetical protein HYFRA_00004739 [Hymenoscyphus fraxineus]